MEKKNDKYYSYEEAIVALITSLYSSIGKTDYEPTSNHYMDLLNDLIIAIAECHDKNGENGANGIGKSAYDLAVENGYTGTLGEWLTSLIGKSGDSGSVWHTSDIAITEGSPVPLGTPMKDLFLDVN